MFQGETKLFSEQKFISFMDERFVNALPYEITSAENLNISKN